MRGQLAWVREQGHDVHVVSSPGAELTRLAAREGVTVHEVPMTREIAIRPDIQAFCRWLKLLRDLQGPGYTVDS